MDKQRELRSDIAWSSADKIGVHGYDLTEDLMGKVNLGDMAFLSVTGRLPDAREARMFNAIVVPLVEHGIVPSTLATRLTYTGAPEAMQAAVAAGLLGLGSVFVGSTEGAARMLKAAFDQAGDSPDVQALARQIVAEHRAARRIVPGLGHPVHKPLDPRTVRMFAVAKETGFHGRYVELMLAVSREAEQATGRSLPVNATGAIGALCCEMGFTPQTAAGLGVMARAIGLVGHVLEEARNPMGMELWHRAEQEAAAHVHGKLRDGAA
jgi:citrate synthase